MRLLSWAKRVEELEKEKRAVMKSIDADATKKKNEAEDGKKRSFWSNDVNCLFVSSFLRLCISQSKLPLEGARRLTVF